MGAIGGMLGTAGGAGGTGFKTPGQAPVINPTTPEGVAAAQTGATNALGGQAGLLAALQGQNAPGVQSSFLVKGNTLADQLAANNGAGIQGRAANQQAGLNAGLGGLNGAGTMATAQNAQGQFNNGLAGMDSTGMMNRAGMGQGDLNAQLAGLGGANAVAGAMGQQGNLAGQLGGAGGIGAQTGAIGGLQDVLAQQQGVANGTGPNPAQAMLNQATGQNVANQAALMAGQRGAGANVGLMARQAAQQGAGIQQNAAGQGAAMQAQQQMNALNSMGQTNQAIAGVGSNLTAQQQAALGQLYGQGSGALNQLQSGLGQQFGQGATGAGLQQAGIGQQFGQGLSAVGANQAGINSLSQQGGNMVNQQTAQMGQNAGVAQNMVGNVANVAGQNVQGNLTNAGQQLGAVQGVNNAQVGSQSSINAGNTALAGGVQKQQGDMIGGALQGAGQAAKLALADGGAVETPMVQAPRVGAASFFGQMLATPQGAPEDSLLKKGASNFASGVGQYATKQMNAPAEGGVAGGDSSDVGSIAMTAARGGVAHDYRGGGGVKARDKSEKATKSGNSYANDKIPAMLSEGEVVIPRSVMSSPDPASAAAKFVSALRARGGGKMADGANPVVEGAPLDAGSPAPAVDTPAATPVEPQAAAPAPQPVAPNAPIDVIGKRPPVTPEELDGQDALVAQDMARGHIKPETMQSLYGKQDTLGKIGTLFGLLVSGAGAGLTHQPNAVLEMMQKQIDNDLEAQKNSNANAQNWLRLSQAAALQRVQIPQVKAQTQGTKAETGLTQAKTGAIPAEIAKTKAATAVDMAQANVLGTAAAKNGMINNMISGFVDQTNKMPPGPMKDTATGKLQSEIIPAAEALKKKNNADAAAKVGLINTVAPQENGKQYDLGVNDKEMMKQIQLGKAADSHAGLSMGIPPSQEAQALKDATLVKQNRATHDAWVKGVEQLDKAFRAGILNKQSREAVIQSVATQMAKLRGIQTNDQMKKEVDSMFPAWEDYGSARKNKIDYTQHQFETNEAGTFNMRPELKEPFPAPPQLKKNKKDSGFSMGEDSAVAAPKKKDSASGTKEGEEQKSKSGRPMIWKNGGWKYK